MCDRLYCYYCKYKETYDSLCFLDWFCKKNNKGCDDALYNCEIAKEKTGE